MEQLQLPTMTENKKINYVYLKMVQLGKEGYKKFLRCLKDQYAVQHAGHLKLYEILDQWMLTTLATCCVAAMLVLPYS